MWKRNSFHYNDISAQFKPGGTDMLEMDLENARWNSPICHLIQSNPFLLQIKKWLREADTCLNPSYSEV